MRTTRSATHLGCCPPDCVPGSRACAARVQDHRYECLIQRALHGESPIRSQRIQHVARFVLLAALGERVLAEHRPHGTSVLPPSITTSVGCRVGRPRSTRPSSNAVHVTLSPSRLPRPEHMLRALVIDPHRNSFSIMFHGRELGRCPVG